ncbi:MAG: phage baseplate protein [Janthinobacterium lividum]
MAAIGAVAIAGSILADVLLAKPRAIGTIIPDVVIEEGIETAVVSTDHPVEQGASITDHAFVVPVRVTMRVGWSDSALLATFDPGYINSVYGELLAIQAARQPITIVTAKRSFDSMLVEELATHTDADTENALVVVCRFKQIIIVQTQVVTLAPQDQQAMPQVTAPVQSQGTVQPKQSALFSLFGS